ncbi:MAG: hypothetical protein QF632_06855 [Candidatus Woesearchaeota archaeon]|jgi:hypothetical protein|nr:hypothetical protein [Candidatus Woesearchaeota archaeon]MDP7324455.1 hypothetical protein [Candidatus Woesearchaeota archaeon]MDP7457115.1 hypothetical protein [Candidatus Woesearchaeota archaeon]|tara:strand:- start:308 stop:637 length:330 start_codon:yes stop_codon:yes gene_type:complete
MKKGHQIREKIGIAQFMELINQYGSKSFISTNHTYFRLNEQERKVFKEIIIKDILLGKCPILVGKQYNGNYAAFYNHSNDVLKIILDIQPVSIHLITFYLIDNKQRPRL